MLLSQAVWGAIFSAYCPKIERAVKLCVRVSVNARYARQMKFRLQRDSTPVPF